VARNMAGRAPRSRRVVPPAMESGEGNGGGAVWRVEGWRERQRYGVEAAPRAARLQGAERGAAKQREKNRARAQRVRGSNANAQIVQARPRRHQPATGNRPPVTVYDREGSRR
jgi:hypothetical protein